MDISELIEIRESLGLYGELWDDLDNNLLTLAFIPKNSKVKLKQQKYGFKNYELLEFLGDSILESITSMILFEEFVIDPKYDYNINEGIMTEFKSQMVRNSTLYCHGLRKNVCKFIKKDNITVKDCADIIESIIGVLYYYLYYEMNNKEALSILHDWYIENFYVDETISNLKKYQTSQYKNTCKKESPIKYCLSDCSLKNDNEKKHSDLQEISCEQIDRNNLKYSKLLDDEQALGMILKYKLDYQLLYSKNPYIAILYAKRKQDPNFSRILCVKSDNLESLNQYVERHASNALYKFVSSSDHSVMYEDII